MSENPSLQKQPFLPMSNAPHVVVALEKTGSAALSEAQPDLLPHPWRKRHNLALAAWLNPLHPHPDPWSLADTSGISSHYQELQMKSSEVRQQTESLKQLRNSLKQHAETRLTKAWAARTSLLRSIHPPQLPPHVLRLLHPQAPSSLLEAWQGYQAAILQAEWDSAQEWPSQALLPPFPEPSPAPIPPLPVLPSPTLWLGWTIPNPEEPSILVPLLISSGAPPRPQEMPELRHQETGTVLVPLTVGVPVCLEAPGMEPIVRALFHAGGLWIEDEPEIE